ncbi:hypothetical protein AWC36_21405 [Brenneria goodwinii]|nr:hypothetical protein AWC36_21405 [Brenneria goodwinii]
MSRKRLDGSILIGQTLAGANAFGMAGWVRPAQHIRCAMFPVFRPAGRLLLGQYAGASSRRQQ